MRFLSISLLLIFLSGCATVGSEKIAAQPPNTKVVAVSMMGNQLKIRHVGTTVFTNAQNDFDVADWNVDRKVEEAANLALQNSGKFVVVKPTSKDYREKFGARVTSWDGSYSLDHFKEGLQSIATESGANLVIVVTEASYGDPFFGTNQNFSGYGIYQRSAFFMENAVNFVTMTVGIYDVKTGEAIANTRQYSSAKRNKDDWIEGESLILSKENEAKSKADILMLLQNQIKESLAELKAVN